MTQNHYKKMIFRAQYQLNIKKMVSTFTFTAEPVNERLPEVAGRVAVNLDEARTSRLQQLGHA